MSARDFKMKDGVLVKYHGQDTDVIIPDGVTSIGKDAFWGCSSLTSITIPDGVTVIGNYAFKNCSSLQSITIPDSVTSIGAAAFQDCKSLTGITIPDGVTSIGEGAFKGCKGLTSITIPNSVTSIGDWAFGNCSSLVSITIPDSVTSIGESAFSRCESLASITIPDSVTSIGDWAFGGCLKLADENGLVIVKNIVFDCKEDVTTVTIPDSVTNIGGMAFDGCSSLASITLPDSVTSIGDQAFWNCSSLASITIPETVTEIGVGAFEGCGKLAVIDTKIKLNAKMMGKYETHVPIVIENPAYLPNDLKPYAVIGYVKKPALSGSNRAKQHLKYIKANAAKLVKLALEYPELLQLMCMEKLIKPEDVEAFLQEAQRKENLEATAILLDYQQNKLTVEEKGKAMAKQEQREEAITDFVFGVEKIEELSCKVFAADGKLTTFTSREEFKACLAACGAVLTETLNEQTDYLITNTPNSGSAKNKKADALGIKKLTEAELNEMIGRKVK